MDNFTTGPLVATPAFDRTIIETAGLVLRGLCGNSLLAIDFQVASRNALARHLESLPKPGQSVLFGPGGHLLWSSASQVLLFSPEGVCPEADIRDGIGEVGYVTDLTDGWAVLELSGPDARSALDRITMPDLSDDVFASGAVTSTVLNHMRVMIWRREETQFILLSASSSRNSLHQVLQTGLGQS